MFAIVMPFSVDDERRVAPVLRDTSRNRCSPGAVVKLKSKESICFIVRVLNQADSTKALGRTNCPHSMLARAQSLIGSAKPSDWEEMFDGSAVF